MLTDDEIVMQACAALDGYVGTAENMQQMLVKIGFFQMRERIGEVVRLLDMQFDCMARVDEAINLLTD